MKRILSMIVAMGLGAAIAWGASHTTTNSFNEVYNFKAVPGDKVQIQVVRSTYSFTTVLEDWTVPDGSWDFLGYATIHGTLE